MSKQEMTHQELDTTCNNETFGDILPDKRTLDKHNSKLNGK